MSTDPKLVKRARRDVDAFVWAMEKCANKVLGASAEVAVITDRLLCKTPWHAAVQAIEEKGGNENA